MIIYSIEKSIKSIVYNPLILLPAFIISILSLFLDNFIGLILQRPLSDIFLFGNQFTNENIGFIILTQYPVELISLILLGLLMLTLSTIALAILSRIANLERLSDAINTSILEWKKALQISIALYITGFVFFTLIIFLTYLITLVGSFLGNLISNFLNLIVLPLLFLIIILFVIVKIIFIFPAMTEENGKKIIAKSFEFSNNKMFSVTLLVIVAFIIYYLINIILEYVGLFFSDLGFLFNIIAQTISLSIFILIIAHYYFSE